MPLSDSKNVYCQPLNHVEITDNDEYIGLFRIIPASSKRGDKGTVITYECEHVLATLLDDVLFQYHQVTNLTTTDSIKYVLNQQITKNWKLGKVEMTRYFSYKWENENLISALFSIPKPFDIAYQWTWDTTSYPWTLNLVEPETEVSCEIRYAHNLRGIEKEEDPSVTFNRIYALGAGEGVNQLNIRKVNNNIPYVQDDESVRKYGLRQYVWADKRFEDAESLKASALGLLKQWKVPKVTYMVSAADLTSITQRDVHNLKMGRIVRMIDPDFGSIEARIVKESKPDITGDPGNIQLEIASKVEDLSTTTVDLERRQQINELYSQGATNIDSYQYNDNCDSANPAKIRFYFPEELVKINECKLSYETDKFRAYEKATKAGGAVLKTTRSGGGIAKSTASGGGSVQTSSSGGGTTTSTTDKTFTSLSIMSGTPENSVGNENWGYHLHEVVLPGNHFSHNHSVTIKNHTHSVNVPAHTHDFDIPNHQHEMEIPAHSHDLEYGIFQYDKLPTKLSIKVDGRTVPITSLNGDNIDIIPYLSKDSEGIVNRGWHTLELFPDDLARVNANIVSQFFIQSKGQYAV